LYLAVVAICGLIFVPLHALAIRAMRGNKLIRTLAASIALSAVIGAGAGWWLLGDSFTFEGARLLASVAGGLTFAGFAGVYCHLGPISVDRSVSSHIVELVYLGPGHRLKEAELFRLYTHADVLGKRFKDCLETGIIERHGKELATTARGALIARIFLGLGRGLGMKLWYLDRHHGQGPPPPGV
jgi:hypothetical protein